MGTLSMGTPLRSGSENPTAVIIGLDSITGLQTARILTAQGIPLVSLARNRRHYCCRTKVCRRILEVDTSSAQLVVALNHLAPDIGPRAVLYPCTDMSVYQLAAHQDQLDSRFCRDLPSLQVIEQLMDKAKCRQHAVVVGLPVPETHLLHSRADAEYAATAATFPCVLKPSLKAAAWEQGAPEKAFLLRRPEDLLSAYDRVAAYAEVLRRFPTTNVATLAREAADRLGRREKLNQETTQPLWAMHGRQLTPSSF